MRADELVGSLTEEFGPIRTLTLKLLIDGERSLEHSIAVSPRPHVAPEAYAMWLFTPLRSEQIEAYQHRFSLQIPIVYRSFLAQLNGLNAFEFSLCGVSPSMAADPPLLDRTTVQPFDISIANRHWKNGQALPYANMFHIGSGPYSTDELIGYFLREHGEIHSFRKNGEKVKSWLSFREFLIDELARAEAAYPEHEEFMGRLIREATAEKQSKSSKRKRNNRK